MLIDYSNVSIGGVAYHLLLFLPRITGEKIFFQLIVPPKCVVRSKRESYRDSEFASRVLADENITVIMKVWPHGV